MIQLFFALTLALAPASQVFRIDVEALRRLGAPVPPSTTDHLQFLIHASGPKVSAIRLTAEVQCDGRILTFSESSEVHGGKAVFIMFVSNVRRAVVLSQTITERLDGVTVTVKGE